MNEEVKSVYKSFSWIVREEGGDAAAWVAGRNYIIACAALTRKKIFHNGRLPWALNNSMTKRVDWLYVEVPYRTSMLQTFETIQWEADPDAETQPAGGPFAIV